MIGAIGDQAAAYSRPSAADPGKRADAVGQQAKAAVAAARETGLELPKNAQGVAASGIARGADPASIFAALVAPVAEGDGVGDVGGVPTTPVDGGLDGLGVPVGEGDVPVDAAPPAPLAPAPPNVAGDDEAPADTGESGETLQVAVVSEQVLSVDDGAVALELLTAAQSD